MPSPKTKMKEDKYQLQNSFFQTKKYFAYNGAGVEKIIGGLMEENAQTFDRYVIEDVTNHLFREPQELFGSDLVARNIQRGRDHGLPSYNAFRLLCGLSELCNWTDKPSNIPLEQWRDLQSVYNSPADIDLYTGGLAEASEPGSALGKTFQCIIQLQFRALMNGDRYFFTHDNVRFLMSPRQIENIKTRTLAQIICDNTRIAKVRTNVFLTGSPYIPCPERSTLAMNIF